MAQSEALIRCNVIDVLLRFIISPLAPRRVTSAPPRTAIPLMNSTAKSRGNPGVPPGSSVSVLCPNHVIPFAGLTYFSIESRFYNCWEIKVQLRADSHSLTPLV